MKLEKTICNILDANKFHPYKIAVVQELSEDDYDRRLEFCETIMGKLDTDDHFINKILFLDEATFMINGTVNRHNCR